MCVCVNTMFNKKDYYMNKISMATFSYFDVGSGNKESVEPERFYHGFVLGLIAERAEDYEIRSNRESGFGRYDIMMIPKDIRKYPAIMTTSPTAAAAVTVMTSYLKPVFLTPFTI